MQNGALSALGGGMLGTVIARAGGMTGAFGANAGQNSAASGASGNPETAVSRQAPAQGAVRSAPPASRFTGSADGFLDEESRKAVGGSLD